MMNCQEARGLFSDRVDDLLAGEERAALDRHLQDCADCRREWERFRRTVNLLHAAEEVRAPAGFARRVVETVRGEPWHRRLARRAFLPLYVKLPLEAAAILVVSTLVIVLYRQGPDVRRAADSPPAPVVTAPAPPSPSPRGEPEASRRVVEAPTSPPAAKQKAAAPAEEKLEAGRADAMREARKSAVPSGPKLATRPEGPFHVVGRLRVRDRATLPRQLEELVRQVGGSLVRDADRPAPESVFEVVVSREAFPSLEAGLARMGEFTVETRAPAFPDQVRIAIHLTD